MFFYFVLFSHSAFLLLRCLCIQLFFRCQ